MAVSSPLNPLNAPLIIGSGALSLSEPVARTVSGTTSPYLTEDGRKIRQEMDQNLERYAQLVWEACQKGTFDPVTMAQEILDIYKKMINNGILPKNNKN
jgi:hypothetical protein